MINIQDCKRVKLSQDIDLKDFDCGDEDLNDFYYNDAILYTRKLLTTTFIYYFQDKPVAFVTYSNDKIVSDNKSTWNRVSRNIENDKRNRAIGYPAVKIGRLGVDINFKRQNIGGQILDFTKAWFITNNKTGCRFLTLDAYNKENVLSFYQKNKFKFLSTKETQNSTRLMFYDLIHLVD